MIPGGYAMAKILYCRDLVGGCPEVFRGETEEDILRQAEEHSKAAHNVREFPKNLRKKMHRLIQQEKAA
jgi:predicted small metal-binding protein